MAEPSPVRLRLSRNRHLRRERLPLSSPSQWTPTPCAPRSTRDPCRTRCWFSAAATPWETSWCVSRRGSRPARPGPHPRLRWSSIRWAVSYKPHVMGIMVGQPYKILNSDGLPHNVHTLPKVNKAFNRRCRRLSRKRPRRSTRKKPIFQVEVRRPPVDERLHRRLPPSVLLGRRARTGSSRSRASTRGPTKSPPGTSGWGRRQPRSRSAPTTRRPRISSSLRPRNSDRHRVGRTAA